MFPMFQLKRKSSHDNIQIVSELSPIRTQYSREYCPFIRCQHFNVMHLFHTSCLPCILNKESSEFLFFYYSHSRQVTSHLDIRVSVHPVAHPVISRFPEIRGFPAALDSSSLIITLSIETVAMEAGDSELIGILGNYILAADTRLNMDTAA